MANRGLTSSWYNIREYEDFVDELEAGDLVEFDRGAYRHWGVCVGKGPSGGARIVHRSNPAETGFGSASFNAKVRI